MTMPDVTGLPVNLDTTYADDGDDASVKLHQQHHDLVHAAVKAASATYASFVDPDGVDFAGPLTVNGVALGAGTGDPLALGYVAEGASRGGFDVALFGVGADSAAAQDGDYRIVQRVLSEGGGSSSRFEVDDYYEVTPSSATAAQHTSAIQAALTAAAPTGGVVCLAPRNHPVLAPIVVPGGVLLLGTSMDYGSPTAVDRGSRITAAAGFTGTAVVQLESSLGTSSGDTGASMAWVLVDAVARAASAIQTLGRRCYVLHCQAWRGTTQAMRIDGQNGYVAWCVTNNNDIGHSIVVTGADSKVMFSQIRQGLASQLNIRGNSCQVIGNHLFAGGFGAFPETPGTDILIDAAVNDVQIVGNNIEGVFGPNITILGDSNTTIIDAVQIVGNTIYQPGDYPDDTYPVIDLKMTATNSRVYGLSITGNTVLKKGGDVGYRSFVRKTGAGQVIAFVCTGNAGSNVYRLFEGIVPDGGGDNAFRQQGGSNRLLLSTQGGRVTATGDGTTTSWTFPHLLGAAPGSLVVTAETSAAAGAWVTSTSTTFTITRATAPTAAAPLAWSWRGQL